jgi:hypothetical protein
VRAIWQWEAVDPMQWCGSRIDSSPGLLVAYGFFVVVLEKPRFNKVRINRGLVVSLRDFGGLTGTSGSGGTYQRNADNENLSPASVCCW